MNLIARAFIIAVAVASTSAGGAATRPLDFERRLRAQEAIERVNYSHQIGATKRFEEAMTREALEKKVRSYLGQSAALEKFWRTPVTAEMLRRETERIAKTTLLPERLREIYRALGNDSRLIQECFIRPALTQRLTRSFFDADERIHAASRRQAEALREDLAAGRLSLWAQDARRQVQSIARRDRWVTERARAGGAQDAPALMGAGEFARWRSCAPETVGMVGPVVDDGDAFVIGAALDETVDGATMALWRVGKTSWEEWWESVRSAISIEDVSAIADASVALPQPSPASTCDPLGVWDNGILDDPPSPPTPRFRHTAIWTGTEMILWGGSGDSAGDRYDPLTDTWRRTSQTNAPPPRVLHTAVWTGTEMIVWGGQAGGIPSNDGGRYDPISDTWSPTTLVGAPSARLFHTAVWTGTEMIVWGGENYLNTGGRYNPAIDTWSPTTTRNAPTGRFLHTAVWIGSKMIVWGGYAYGAQNTGGVYDPAGDSWSATASADAPSARLSHTAVWTGTEMVVWGGLDGDSQMIDSGGRYEPVANRWSPTTLSGAPEARHGHTVVWTGSRMIVWGGEGNLGEVGTGGQYLPAADTWSATSTVGAPAGRSSHTAVWTGALMIVWGGGQYSPLDTGGRYDPLADTWTPTLKTSLGSQAGVWSGNELLIWDGSRGRRYSLLTDTWTDMSRVNQPSSRAGHVAVWTGDEMIVWGGYPRISGGRYDPLTDTWARTSTIGAPSSRNDPTAVWTGAEMVVWGGWVWAPYLYTVNTGGRYDPAADKWTPTSTAGAPSARAFHATVWTGTEMIVWGGADFMSASFDDGEVATGGRYDPAADAWSPTSMAGVPERRQEHTAVWSGSEMIVFGGELNEVNFQQTYRTGGRYDPTTNTWAATPTTGSPRTYNHKAVWTGTEMIVVGGLGHARARYNPAAGTWLPMSAAGDPGAGPGTVAVWTGNEMIVWNGTYGGGGGRYTPPSPATDADADGVGTCDGDCDDADPSVHPGAPEICDGLDNNCDGTVPASEADADGDGFRGCQNDCNDSDPAINPLALDLPGNAVDENCDGTLACDPRAVWKNHGQFVRCVAQDCGHLVTAGAVSKAQCETLISRAARSNTGRKQRQSTPPAEP